jgi:hypothetical protein
MSTINRLSSILIASALMALGTTGAMAQTAKKAAPKAGEAGQSFKRNDKVMTREELRACMALKASNSARVAELNLKNEQSKKEREELANAPDSAQALRAEAEKQLAIVKAADELVRAHSVLVNDWNTRMAEFEVKSKEMRNADRARQKLKSERYELKAKDDVLMADRAAKVVVYEAAVNAANAKINARATNNDAWNKRNEAMIAEEAALEESREKYSDECASRRFKEDDETAIKAGK